jgi:hypothetical protein
LDYAKRGKDVKAMLEQDMTGFYNATIENKKEFGLMMDVGKSEFLDWLMKDFNMGQPTNR